MRTVLVWSTQKVCLFLLTRSFDIGENLERLGEWTELSITYKRSSQIQYKNKQNNDLLYYDGKTCLICPIQLLEVTTFAKFTGHLPIMLIENKLNLHRHLQTHAINFAIYLTNLYMYKRIYDHCFYTYVYPLVTSNNTLFIAYCNIKLCFEVFVLFIIILTSLFLTEMAISVLNQGLYTWVCYEIWHKYFLEENNSFWNS